MSANNNNTQIFTTNTDENNLTSNGQSYDDLLFYCSLRKQFDRTIPSYYTEIQKKPYSNKKRNNCSNKLEQYKKLKEDINTMKESIELLKETKRQKLKHIEELRILMIKAGNKNINIKDKKQFNNINYCCREKKDTKEGFRCQERKGSDNINCFKASSDESLSMAPTASGLSSGKDDDIGGENSGNPQRYSALSCSSNGSCCFMQEDLQNKEMLHVPPNNTTLVSN